MSSLWTNPVNFWWAQRKGAVMVMWQRVSDRDRIISKHIHIAQRQKLTTSDYHQSSHFAKPTWLKCVPEVRALSVLLASRLRYRERPIAVIISQHSEANSEAQYRSDSMNHAVVCTMWCTIQSLSFWGTLHCYNPTEKLSRLQNLDNFSMEISDCNCVHKCPGHMKQAMERNYGRASTR